MFFSTLATFYKKWARFDKKLFFNPFWNLIKAFEKSQYPYIRRYLKNAKARADTKPRYIELLTIERNILALELEDDSEEEITDEVSSAQ